MFLYFARALTFLKCACKIVDSVMNNITNSDFFVLRLWYYRPDVVRKSEDL